MTDELIAEFLAPVANARNFLFNTFGIVEDEEGEASSGLQQGINKVKKDVSSAVIKSIFGGA